MQTQTIVYQNYLTNCQKGISAEVVLGSPRFADCRNFGICRMNLAPQNSSCNCKDCLACFLRIDAPTGRLLIHLPVTSISKTARQRFFSADTFRIDDPFYLPKAISAALAISANGYYIDKGEYPLLDDAHFLTVSLRLKAVATIMPEQAVA